MDDITRMALDDSTYNFDEPDLENNETDKVSSDKSKTDKDDFFTENTTRIPSRMPFRYRFLGLLLGVCLGFAIGGILEDNVIITPLEKSEDNVVLLSSTPLEQKYTDFNIALEENKVSNVYMSERANYFYAEESGNFYVIDKPNNADFQVNLLEKGFSIRPLASIKTPSQIRNIILFYALNIFFMVLIVKIFLNKLWNSIFQQEVNRVISNQITAKLSSDTKETDGGFSFGPFMGGFGLKRSTDDSPMDVVTDRPNVSFDDVAGLVEVKNDMKILVDFLVNREKYEEAGAKLPKGVILYGPPGTGKTLLARAIAGESNVSFISMCGSDFEESLVGVGARRVRDLFAEARKKAPCIIFIDEIDTVAGKRNKRGNSETKQTVNALLSAMDGFKQDENILVIGATNRLEDIDDALLRGGRFANRYCVPLPSTPDERLEVINMYVKNKKLGEDVDLIALSKKTTGFSPADIESLLNDAAIMSVQQKQAFITQKLIDEAVWKIILEGHLKKDQKGRDDEELRIVARHESGHALIRLLNKKVVDSVTILSSTSGAGGVTLKVPDKEHLLSVKDLKLEIMELYGGRIAEQLLSEDNDEITTGAYNDIEKATDIIKRIITSYGMDKSFGLLNLDRLDVPQDVIIDKEVALAKEIEQQATELLENNKGMLKALSELLLEKETLNEADLQEFCKEYE